MSAYTVKQVARILGYSTNSIYTFLKEKRIKGVRVGKGRFRIPQSELDRLLLTKDARALTPDKYGLPLEAVPGVTQALPGGVIEYPRETVASADFMSGIRRVDVPSLFDWFVGIGSICLGLAMFLFSRVREEFSFQQFLPLIPAVRMTLIAGGFGLLLSDIVSRKTSVWHHVFHWALVFAYGIYTFILFRTGNWEGVVIFGVLAVSLAYTFFTGIGGIAGFAVYIVGILILLPTAAFIAPEESSLLPMIAFLPFSPSVLGFVWIMLVAFLGGIIWLGYMRNRRVFWIGMTGVSVIFIALAMHFATDLVWGRALFILIAAMLSLFVPVWQSLTFAHKRDRAFVFMSFGTLLVLYILVIGILRVMQTNVLDFAGRELGNKASYGKSLIESTMASTKTLLSSAVTNPLLISGTEKAKSEDLTTFARALFEGSSLFRRILILDSEGSIITMYPPGTPEADNTASSDYFLSTMASRRITVTDAYRQEQDRSLRRSIVIAVPVINGKKVITGVIAGFMDLDVLGARLQQIASSGNGEYFVVIDGSGKRLIHPQSDQIGGVMEQDDPIRLGLTGSIGVAEGYSTDGIRSLVAYSAVGGDTGWALAIKSPVRMILEASRAATITIFSVTVISIFIVTIFLLSHRTRVSIANNLPDDDEAPVRNGPGSGITRTRKKRIRIAPGEDTS